MSTNKTVPTESSVKEFLASVDAKRQPDCATLVDLMREITGEEPQMWGTSIVGFGSYHYKYASGREGDMPVVGFSPRKQALTLYIMDGFEQYDALLAKLGKFKTGKSCLYIKKTADVDMDTLRELVRQSVEHVIATNAHNA